MWMFTSHLEPWMFEVRLRRKSNIWHFHLETTARPALGTARYHPSSTKLVEADGGGGAAPPGAADGATGLAFRLLRLLLDRVEDGIFELSPDACRHGSNIHW